MGWLEVRRKQVVIHEQRTRLKQNGNKYEPLTTLIPVLVASREASRSGVNIGLNATVNAESIIQPIYEQQLRNDCKLNSYDKQDKSGNMRSVSYYHQYEFQNPTSLHRHIEALFYPQYLESNEQQP